jgi:Zn-finger nucleic acid-binding protein
MNERHITTMKGPVTIDQCSSCRGIWFDTGEAERLKDTWRSDWLDSGDPAKGRKLNEVRDVKCPRCDKKMEMVSDPKQKHIRLETCLEHGVFMDAGEFKDYKNETLMDIFRDAVAAIGGE